MDWVFHVEIWWCDGGGGCDSHSHGSLAGRSDDHHQQEGRGRWCGGCPGSCLTVSCLSLYGGDTNSRLIMSARLPAPVGPARRHHQHRQQTVKYDKDRRAAQVSHGGNIISTSHTELPPISAFMGICQWRIGKDPPAFSLDDPMRTN